MKVTHLRESATTAEQDWVPVQTGNLRGVINESLTTEEDLIYFTDDVYVEPANNAPKLSPHSYLGSESLDFDFNVESQLIKWSWA